jgi:hypothetical protein
MVRFVKTQYVQFRLRTLCIWSMRQNCLTIGRRPSAAGVFNNGGPETLCLHHSTSMNNYLWSTYHLLDQLNYTYPSSNWHNILLQVI